VIAIGGKAGEDALDLAGEFALRLVERHAQDRIRFADIEIAVMDLDAMRAVEAGEKRANGAAASGPFRIAADERDLALARNGDEEVAPARPAHDARLPEPDRIAIDLVARGQRQPLAQKRLG